MQKVKTKDVNNKIDQIQEKLRNQTFSKFSGVSSRKSLELYFASGKNVYNLNEKLKENQLEFKYIMQDLIKKGEKVSKESEELFDNWIFDQLLPPLKNFLIKAEGNNNVTEKIKTIERSIAKHYVTGININFNTEGIAPTTIKNIKELINWYIHYKNFNYDELMKIEQSVK
jgi:hypothetical protein